MAVFNSSAQGAAERYFNKVLVIIVIINHFIGYYNLCFGKKYDWCCYSIQTIPEDFWHWYWYHHLYLSFLAKNFKYRYW